MKNTILCEYSLIQKYPNNIFDNIFFTPSTFHVGWVKTLSRMHYFWSLASRSFRGVDGSRPLGIYVSRLPLPRPRCPASEAGLTWRGRTRLSRRPGTGPSVTGRSRTRAQVLLVYSL